MALPNSILNFSMLAFGLVNVQISVPILLTMFVTGFMVSNLSFCFFVAIIKLVACICFFHRTLNSSANIDQVSPAQSKIAKMGCLRMAYS